MVIDIYTGSPGAGKSALAATIALESEFPFIKMISSESMVGYSDSAKLAHITKIFNDSYKSPLSVVVVDNIERLVDWVNIGPRFSNTVLQALLVLFKKRPPKNKKLFVIATSNNEDILKEMGILDTIDISIYVPQVKGTEELKFVLYNLKAFKDEEIEEIVKVIVDCKMEIDIPVKKLIMIIEMAIQDSDKVGKFIMSLQEI